MSHKTKRNSQKRQSKKRIKDFVRLINKSNSFQYANVISNDEYLYMALYKDAMNIYGTTNMSFHDFRKACILSGLSIPTQTNKQCYVWQKY